MYKLINIETGETVTTSEEKVQFGGPWGALDTEGKPTHEWVEIVPTVEEILEEYKTPILAEIKQKLSKTDYKCLKFVDGSMTAEEYEPVKAERLSLREAYNAIESATTTEEVDNVKY